MIISFCTFGYFCRIFSRKFSPAIFCLVILIPTGGLPRITNRFLSPSSPARSFRTTTAATMVVHLSRTVRRCRRLSLFHFTGARFPEISSTYSTTTSHLRATSSDLSPLSLSISLIKCVCVCMYMYARAPTFYSTIFLSRVRTKRRQPRGGGGGWGSALRPPQTPTRACIQAVSGG